LEYIPVFMSLKELVEKFVLQIIDQSKYYLVDIHATDSKLRKKVVVYLDSDEGISIDECGVISQQLGKELEEVIDTAFTLEVSSPGADSPLKFDRQYLKNIGRSLKIITLSGEEFKGELKSFETGILVIQPEKKKKIVPEPITLELKNIKEAKVVISFK